MRFIALGIQRNHTLHRLDRLGIILGLAVERAQKRVQLLSVVALFEHRLQNFDGLLGLLLAIVEIGGLHPGVDVQLAFFGDALERLQRFVVGLELDVGRAEIVARAIVFRVAGKHQIEFRGGPLEIAFFEGDQADLDPGLARIDLGPFQGFELTQRFVQFVLPDVELAQTPARPNILRIDRSKRW